MSTWSTLHGFSIVIDTRQAVTPLPLAYSVTLVHETYSSIFIVEQKSIFTKLSLGNHDIGSKVGIESFLDEYSFELNLKTCNRV